jgi:transposase
LSGAVAFDAPIFVAVLGAGSYTFAEATRSHSKPSPPSGG